MPPRRALSETAVAQQLCQRLRSNDASLGDTLLCLGGEQYTASALSTSWSALLKALPNASAVTQVQLGEHLVRELDEAELARIVIALGTLPSLTHLDVSWWESDPQARQTISTRTLAQFLRTSRSIETLIVWPFLSIDTVDELNVLKNAVRSHPSLRSFCLFKILTPPPPAERNNNNNTQHVSLDSLLDSLATVPHLTHVQLAPGFSVRSSWPGLLSRQSPSLATLLQKASHLELLALRNAGVRDEHVLQVFANDDHHNDRVLALKSLDLRFNPHITDAVGYKALVESVANTNRWARLEHVDLDWTNTGCATALRETLEFHLDLNRAGRYDWECNPEATGKDKLDVLAASRNVNVTFCLLQRNPSALGQILAWVASEQGAALARK